MRTLKIAVGFLAVLLPVGTQALAQCPTDTLVVCGVTTTSSAPSYSVLGCSGGSGASYDLVAGELEAGANEPVSDAVVIAEDIYTLTGPSSNGPVSFSVNLTVWAATAVMGYVTAEVSGSGGTEEITIGCGGCSYTSYSRTLSLPLIHAVGEPFRLRLMLHAAGPARRLISRASGRANLAFALPHGYTVTSCQGNPPTAARTLGWGRLKAIYR